MNVNILIFPQVISQRLNTPSSVNEAAELMYVTS